MPCDGLTHGGGLVARHNLRASSGRALLARERQASVPAAFGIRYYVVLRTLAYATTNGEHLPLKEGNISGAKRVFWRRVARHHEHGGGPVGGSAGTAGPHPPGTPCTGLGRTAQPGFNFSLTIRRHTAHAGLLTPLSTGTTGVVGNGRSRRPSFLPRAKWNTQPVSGEFGFPSWRRAWKIASLQVACSPLWRRALLAV